MERGVDMARKRVQYKGLGTKRIPRRYRASRPRRDPNGHTTAMYAMRALKRLKAEGVSSSRVVLTLLPQ